MEYVINTSYGRFGLSHDAMKILIKNKSELLTKKSLDKYSGNNLTMTEEKYNDKDTACPSYAINGYAYELDFFSSSEVRCHRDLINVVKKLKSKANGIYAKLKIIDCPLPPDRVKIHGSSTEVIVEQVRVWS